MFKRIPKFLVMATLSIVALGMVVSPTFARQDPPEKTFLERSHEFWDKMAAGMESNARAAGDEFRKLKAESAKATGSAREKMDADMAALGKKWAAAREKLSTSMETHMDAMHEEMKTLKEKSAKASGPAREKMDAEMARLRDDWGTAREKMGAVFSSNMKATHEEYEHLKDQAATSSADAKSKLGPRMEKLKAEWAANREKLSAHLDADLKRTREEMEKLGESTTSAAKAAKEKLAKHFQDLRSRSEDLAREKSVEDSR